MREKDMIGRLAEGAGVSQACAQYGVSRESVLDALYENSDKVKQAFEKGSLFGEGRQTRRFRPHARKSWS